MANICDGCGESVYRTKFVVSQKKFLGIECGCTARDRVQRSTVNPFAIVFDHVYDELGQKLKVENSMQLSRAEQRLGFESVVLNRDAQNFDDPTHKAPRQPQVREVMRGRTKFARY